MVVEGGLSHGINLVGFTWIKAHENAKLGKSS